MQQNRLAAPQKRVAPPFLATLDALQQIAARAAVDLGERRNRRLEVGQDLAGNWNQVPLFGQCAKLFEIRDVTAWLHAATVAQASLASPPLLYRFLPFVEILLWSVVEVIRFMSAGAFALQTLLQIGHAVPHRFDLLIQPRQTVSDQLVLIAPSRAAVMAPARALAEHSPDRLHLMGKALDFCS